MAILDCQDQLSEVLPALFLCQRLIVLVALVGNPLLQSTVRHKLLNQVELIMLGVVYDLIQVHYILVFEEL